MAFQFQKKPVATLKATLGGTSGKEQIYIYGVTTADSVTPEIAVTQTNKLLGIGSKFIVADEKMKLTIEEEAVNNG